VDHSNGRYDTLFTKTGIENADEIRSFKSQNGMLLEYS
jgi:hypothetical protein